MKAVLDTNVLVSALINPFGPPGRVLDLALAGRVRWVYDDRIIAEYREVLTRKHFGFPNTMVADLLDFLQSEGEHVTAPPLPAALPDQDDIPFLEVAGAGGAILITGNLAHFPSEHRRGVTVLSPADFLAHHLGPET